MVKNSRSSMRKGTGILAGATLAFLCACGLAQAQGANYVWLEGETPSSINVANNPEWTARSEWISEGKWLRLGVEQDKVEAGVPEGGIIVSYDFNVAAAGEQELWNRIGFGASRTDFEWRVDNGEWARIPAKRPVLDLMALALWTDIGWMKLGQQSLSAGKHTLQIRLPKEKAEDGKWRNVTYASDAVVVAPPGVFSPNSKYKPGENYRDATDEEATKNVFQLPEPSAAGARSSVKLSGLWEVARHDDVAPGEVGAPIRDFPAKPLWKAINIPSDKNLSRPDLQFAHRLWYRTRVNVPASQVGRSFYVEFPQNNLITTVYANGQYCGFDKNPFSRIQIDVTKAIKPGVNEIWVGIKDAWYGFSANPKNPDLLLGMFYFPLEWQKNGFLNLDYPVWNAFQSGILATPSFTVAGSTYVSDVFAKPSVAKKQMIADLTLTNPTNAAVNGEIQWEAVNTKTGAVEKTFASKPFSVGANGTTTVTVADGWTNPKLWWPNDPNLYDLRTTLVVGGKPVDVQTTRFGFREWGVNGVNGTKYTLNGVVWNLWAEITVGENREQWLKNYRESHQRLMRYSDTGQADNDMRWYGLETPDALRFFDENGVVVRRNGPLDGEVIGYNFNENDPDKRAANGGSEVRYELMKNWREQMVAQVKGERNHPSIHIWTTENEFAYINLINLLGNSENMDRYEREIIKTSEALTAVDPTRHNMIDGGGATKFQALPTHGDHYMYSGDSNPSAYPDLAYQPNVLAGGRGRWEWDMKRPRYVAEDYFATGINPADYAWIGGENAFQGKTSTRDAAARIYRMLEEGYRWGNYYAGWHFWIGRDYWSEADVARDPYYNSNAWRAVFAREYDWTFGSGQKVKRNFGIFNDTQYPDPLTFTRAIVIGNKTVWTKSTTHTVAPGTNAKFEEELPIPTATTRQEGKLVLTLKADGKEIFRDTKNISILPALKVAAPKPAAPKAAPKATPAKARRASFEVVTRAHAQTSAATSTALTAKNFFVYDPKGTTVAFLRRVGQPFTPLNSLANLPAAGRVLLVGSDALDATNSTSSTLAAYAATGKRVVVLDQQNPLKYQAIPAEVESTNITGNIAFGEDLGHPALRGLQQKDFTQWRVNQPLFRNAYVKPTRGAKSLVQSGQRLQNSVLVEVPVGTGLMLLNQFAVGQNHATNPVAQRLVMNLINYGSTYKLEYRTVAAVTGNDAQLAKVMDAIGVQYAKATDPLAAISNPQYKLVVVSATPANLKALAGNLARVNAFTQRGGYIVFQGLTPEGLADYNKIVGFDHMIRKMRREKVSFASTRDPLSSGITLGDIVMLSGERMFGWTADEFVADDEFSYIVDYDEVAPFGSFKNDFHYNLVNGLVNADSWKYIVNEDKANNVYSLTLPKPQTITEFTWVGNTNYNLTSRVDLQFDGGDKLPLKVNPDGSPQTFAIAPPRSGKQIDIINAEFTDLPDKRGLIGADNIYLKAARPAGFYQKVKPLLNVGGLMHYPRGNGGILLSNLWFKDSEAVPANALKKRTIFSTLLRNLKAPFSGAKTVVAGANLKYTPVNFGVFKEKLNQYRTDRGWFGDNNFTFNLLPTGNQKFAGVTYNIWDFPTSPVPTAIMLGAGGIPNNPPQEVRDIPINLKADALFFLHTARIDQRRNEGEVRENKKYELARYIIHYADGQDVTVPIYSEIDIDDYRQQTPRAIPGAQIAWTGKYAGTEYSAVAYSKQWNNPRPDVAIKSIDFTYGNDRRGVPVLLAITAANAQ